MNNVGRVRDAIDLAKNMIELPRHPLYNAVTRVGDRYTKRSSYYGRLRLFQTLRDWELWDELIALTDTPYLELTDVPMEQIRLYRYLGIAYFNKGDMRKGNAQLAQLGQLLKEQQTAADEATSEAEVKATQTGKSKSEIANEVQAVSKPFESRISMIKKTMDALQGYKAILDEEYETAFRLMKRSTYVNPADLSRVRILMGETEEAISDLESYVRKRRNEVLPLAHLIELLWDARLDYQADVAFEELRDMAGTADLNTPVLTRLAPIAKQLDFPEDWRNDPRPPPGDRPDHDTLGPMRWQPPLAPDWTLTDAASGEYSLEDYRGRPVIVIFYLGYGCLHCAEQLQAFGPKAQDFENAGYSLIAISTDDHDGLQQSLDNYEGGDIPFPLVSNAEPYDVFKAYRCYDEFEELPLHGTFLIDPDGRVRWNDVSYEPFLDPDFLLVEANRLLGQTHADRYIPAASERSQPPTPLARSNQTNENSPVSTESPQIDKPSNTDAAADNRVINSIGMQLVAIPDGKFLMGSSDAGRHEQPQHQVHISQPFFMGRYEVTQAQYKAVMGKNRSTFPGSNQPVETISWHDAMEFCGKLSALPDEKAAGRVYRLPTEAEWEYACRAGSTSTYCFGDEEGELGEQCWYRENSDRTTHAVGAKRPNSFGLYDMHGNVREWCSDWYAATYYEHSPAIDPTGPSSGTLRVFRGGSWGGPASFCRAASRFSIHPNYKNDYVGFRIVLSAE